MEDQTSAYNDELESNEPAEGVSWKAHEFEYHDKNVLWYLVLTMAVGGFIVLAVLTKQWMMIAVIVAVGAALFVLAARKPKHQSYELDETGLTVQGKNYPLNQFQSYNIVEGHKWRGVELDPIKRFMPRVALPLEEETSEDVLSILAGVLPRVDREPDLIERWTRKLKF